MRLKFTVSWAMSYFILCTRVYDNDKDFKFYV